MTNHLPPPSDEDLSAALDGEADASAQARIAAHPDSKQRAAALEHASALLASLPVSDLDHATTDHLVETALNSPIAPGQPRRNAQPARWLVAAVVAVLVGVGLTLVWTGRQSSEDQAFDTVNSEIAESNPAPAGENTRSGSDLSLDSAGTAEAYDAALLLDLGAFESGDALRRALATASIAEVAVEPSGALAKASTASISRCAEQLSVALDLPAPPIAQASATVDGVDVLVYEFTIDSFDDGQPTTLVAAVDTAACAQVVVFER